MHGRTGSQSHITTGSGRFGHVGSHVDVADKATSITANKYSQTDLHLEDVPITVEQPRSNGINNNVIPEQNWNKNKLPESRKLTNGSVIVNGDFVEREILFGKETSRK